MLCKHCGKWRGLFDDEHQDCAEAAAAPPVIPKGTVNLGQAWQVVNTPHTAATRVIHVVPLSRIVWGVVLGNFLTTVIAIPIWMFIYLLIAHR